MRSLALFGLTLFITALRAGATEYPIEYRCRGLEAYEIRGTHDVDWAWGTIRAKNGGVTMGFSLGPMVAESVPDERPAGFRSFKVEHIGKVVLRYGLNVRAKQIQATLTGAPMDRRLNLVARPKDIDAFVALARKLATAPCRGTIDRLNR